MNQAQQIGECLQLQKQQNKQQIARIGKPERETRHEKRANKRT